MPAVRSEGVSHPVIEKGEQAGQEPHPDIGKLHQRFAFGIDKNVIVQRLDKLHRDIGFFVEDVSRIREHCACRGVVGGEVVYERIILVAFKKSQGFFFGCSLYHLPQSLQKETFHFFRRAFHRLAKRDNPLEEFAERANVASADVRIPKAGELIQESDWVLKGAEV